MKPYVWVATVDNSSLFNPSTNNVILAVGVNRNATRREALRIANDNHRRIGIVNDELVYIEYSLSDIKAVKFTLVDGGKNETTRHNETASPEHGRGTTA